jgi:hypothetical protein
MIPVSGVVWQAESRSRTRSNRAIVIAAVYTAT